MKKIFAVLAVSAFLVACDTTTDSTETTTDTVAPVPVETPAAVDTATMPINDSLRVDTPSAQ